MKITFTAKDDWFFYVGMMAFLTKGIDSFLKNESAVGYIIAGLAWLVFLIPIWKARWCERCRLKCNRASKESIFIEFQCPKCNSVYKTKISGD